MHNHKIKILHFYIFLQFQLYKEIDDSSLKIEFAT